MRADAQRSVDGIRSAAIDVFRERGLTIPLEDVAKAAGRAKGTIYHRFGGRSGLIDAVIDELVAERVNGIMDAVTASDAGPCERLQQYLRSIWMLQFDEPAANDVLLRAVPDSQVLIDLCDRARDFARSLLNEAQDRSGIRADLTEEDLFALIWERGIIARSTTATRPEYERRLELVFAGLRA